MILEEQYVVAFDVETSGPDFEKNALLSIGASLQNGNGEEVDYFSVNIEMPEGTVFDEDCKRDFWDKNPGALGVVLKDAISPEKAMTAFGEFLRKIETLPNELLIISDNPSFDIAWIDTYLGKYLGRRPLRYSEEGKYRMVWDSVTMQKTWLCFRDRIHTLLPPSKHRDLLGLESAYPHDHTPLNDARTIANFFIQSRKQMREFIEILPKKKEPKTIKILEHDPAWLDAYSDEESLIKESLGGICLDIHHIGSTSIPGLLAKPIIDILLVVPESQDPESLDHALARVGYKYKGNYNLPFRRMYGKKEPYEIYLHAHEVGSAEIDLNLKFRDTVRADASLIKIYGALKASIISTDSSHSKLSSTGITTYNLHKNGFIVDVLRKSGFEGICPRLCTQEEEWEAYKFVQGTLLGSDDISEESKTLQHVVLYKGTEIVAAAGFDMTPPNSFIKFIGPVGKSISDSESAMYTSYLLGFLEEWARRSKISLINTGIDGGDIFSKYTKIGSNLIKVL